MYCKLSNVCICWFICKFKEIIVSVSWSTLGDTDMQTSRNTQAAGREGWLFAYKVDPRYLDLANLE